MAKDKKGFVLYADQKELFTELTDQEAGQLIKHIFKYVNDENPEPESQIVKISFIPIKQQLKRDLKHWESVRAQRSKAGKASANKRQQNATKSTYVESVQQKSTNSTVIDKVIVKDKVIVNDNVKVNVKENYNNKEYSEFIELFHNEEWFETIAQQLSITPDKIESLAKEFEKCRKLDMQYEEKSIGELRSWFINFAKVKKDAPTIGETREEKTARLIKMGKR